MASRLFYLGFTGKSYRIALIATEHMPSVRLPVKDCPMLPDLPLVNFTVVDGVTKLNALNKWDGLCKKDNWYVLGTLN